MQQNQADRGDPLHEGTQDETGRRPRAVTISAVAKRAGVSTATVSHVINGTRFVSAANRQRVLDVMKELDYRPSLVARGLRSQKSGIIGMLMPIMLYDNFDYYFMKLAHGVRERLNELGYDLILTSYDNTLADERRCVESMYVRSIDGLVILPTEGDHSYLVGNEKVNFPIVSIDREADGYAGDCVLADNFSGALQATRALIAKGHRRIGFITNDLEVTTVCDRIRGYREALEQGGIAFDDRICRRGPYEYHSGYELTRSLLSENPDIGAIFFADNLLLMGGLQYMNEQHYAIPDSIAVIGFDDFEWERVTVPPLSVVRQPAHEIGVKAADVLVQRIREPGASYKNYWFKTDLVIRRSF